jgi:hypothetical protein
LAYLESVKYHNTTIFALGIERAFSFGEEKFVPVRRDLSLFRLTILRRWVAMPRRYAAEKSGL